MEPQRKVSKDVQMKGGPYAVLSIFTKSLQYKTRVDVAQTYGAGKR